MTTPDDTSNGAPTTATTNGNAERHRRPAPERTAPERSFTAAAFGAPPEGGGAKEPAPGEPNDGRRDAAYRTLNQAYTLVDDYLRQGQRMAEAVWLPLSGLEGGGEPAAAAPERFLRAMSDMTLAWVEVMQQWTSQAPRQKAATGSAGPFGAGQPAPAPGAPGAPASPPSSQALSISVQAKGRVETTVEVMGGADPSRLMPTELRAYSGSAPPITDVVLACRAGEPPTVRISVPDGHPPGTYSGLLLEGETQRPRGTISVVVA